MSKDERLLKQGAEEAGNRPAPAEALLPFCLEPVRSGFGLFEALIILSGLPAELLFVCLCHRLTANEGIETQLTPEQEQPVSGQTAIRVVIRSSGGKVNIRMGNGTSRRRITAAAPGTVPEYVAALNGWQAIKVGSRIGWVLRRVQRGYNGIKQFAGNPVAARLQAYFHSLFFPAG